jgi:hypothetical protein
MTDYNELHNRIDFAEGFAVGKTLRTKERVKRFIDKVTPANEVFIEGVEQGAKKEREKDQIRSPLPDDDLDLIPIDEFVEEVKNHNLIDDDGFGEWSDGSVVIGTRHVSPGMFDEKDIPEGATHVLWFNK